MIESYLADGRPKPARGLLAAPQVGENTVALVKKFYTTLNKISERMIGESQLLL